MTEMHELTKLVELTDTRGRNVLPAYVDKAEPDMGSVVLTHGTHGTAWQRRFTDGMWHRAGGGRPRPWSWLQKQQRLHLAYAAPVRAVEPRPEEKECPCSTRGEGAYCRHCYDTNGPKAVPVDDPWAKGPGF